MQVKLRNTLAGRLDPRSGPCIDPGRVIHVKRGGAAARFNGFSQDDRG